MTKDITITGPKAPATNRRDIMLADMRWWLAGFVIMLAQAQQQPSSDEGLLEKIRAKMAENMKRLPDYTCTETIQRWGRSPTAKKFQMLDTVRVEIAYVGGKELFGWPGSGKIDDPDITKLVGGASGNGDFALVPRAVFLVKSTTIQYAGETDLNGKHVVYYNYRVQPSSGYRIRTESGEGIAGYHGSFLVDAGTLDLVRLELSADDIPAGLGIASITNVMNYERIAIGNSTFPLPRDSELVMTASNGRANRNHTSFHDCRQYTGESVVKYDVPVPEPTAAAIKAPVAAVNLPDDFTVDLSLETPIDSASAAVGDSIHATLREAIKSKRDTVVPKGARLDGRISMLEKHSGFYLLDLQFTSVEFEDGHAALSGRENRILRTPSRGRTSNSVSLVQQPMVFRTDRLKLPHGADLTLRSRLLKSKDNDSIRP